MESKDILFRCSSLGHLTKEAREKSPAQKYVEAIDAFKKCEQEYIAIANKETKTAINKLARIAKLKDEVEELREIKDKPFLSDGVKTHCVDTFVSAYYGRKEEHHGKELDKGNAREEDSITLLSRVTKTFFTKNETKISNEFICGTPDLYIGGSIQTAEKIIDTKTSWSAHTFFRSANKPLDTLYYWQVQGYMALTGAKKGAVAFCLVNGTNTAILDEKRKLAWSMGITDPSNGNEEYKAKCRQIEINHIFDIKHFVDENPGFDFDNDVSQWLEKKTWDIPMADRVHLFEIERNEADINALYKRIIDCREWMEENLFTKKQIVTAA